jgi:hypothetical protein
MTSATTPAAATTTSRSDAPYDAAEDARQNAVDAIAIDAIQRPQNGLSVRSDGVRAQVGLAVIERLR